MKRHLLLVGLLALVFAGVALADPPTSPYIAFHQATYLEGKHTKHDHTVWITIDGVGNGLGTTTHAYFSTGPSDDPAGGDACATKGSNGPDFVTVSDELVVFDHYGTMKVPVTVCGENHSEVIPAASPGATTCPGGEAIPLVLTTTPFDNHTHLGLANANLCIENTAP